MDDYTPADLLDSINAGAATPLIWVGAAIAGAIVLWAILVGLRAAVGFFFNLAGGYRYDRDSGSWTHRDA